MRRDLGGAGVSDEELLLRWLLNKEDIAAMRAGRSGSTSPTRHPLVRLMAELGKFADCNLIQVSKPGFSLTLRKAPPGS